MKEGSLSSARAANSVKVITQSVQRWRTKLQGHTNLQAQESRSAKQDLYVLNRLLALKNTCLELTDER
jgi:hypothetical protein